MNSEEIIRACRAVVIKNDVSGDFNVSTDTRTIKKGDIYLPLKGENFDGEKFIDEALDKGAVGYFTTSNLVYDNAKLILKVENTLTAYLEISQAYKNIINPKVIAVTGSSGKTTTKEMIYSVIKEHFNTVKTFSNHNNEIGFCQTVFSMSSETQVLIIEMGMRGLGEIELISQYAQPDYALITNVGNAHIGRLGSVENIARAKCEIVKNLKPNATLLALNQDIIKKCVEFNGEKIYVDLSDLKILENKISYSKFVYKNKKYELNVEGEYNIINSLFAIETGYMLGMTYQDIKTGLCSYKPIEKRWETEDIRGLKVINDSYNANPESMKASVKTFVELYNNPVVVLGDMGELGDNEVELHRQVGQYFSDMKNVNFLLVGKLVVEIANELNKKGISVKSFDSNEAVSRYILDNFGAGYTIFLKASRFMKFEEIIENLKRGNI